MVTNFTNRTCQPSCCNCLSLQPQSLVWGPSQMHTHVVGPSWASILRKLLWLSSDPKEPANTSTALGPGPTSTALRASSKSLTLLFSSMYSFTATSPPLDVQPSRDLPLQPLLSQPQNLRPVFVLTPGQKTGSELLRILKSLADHALKLYLLKASFSSILLELLVTAPGDEVCILIVVGPQPTPNYQAVP